MSQSTLSVLSQPEIEESDPLHFVQMETAFGGNRIVDWLAGEQLPRIC